MRTAESRLENLKILFKYMTAYAFKHQYGYMQFAEGVNIKN